LPLYCNGWRASQYEDVFEREMTVLDCEDGRTEGEEYLTPALLAELSEYTTRDLLMPTLLVRATKKTPAGAPGASGTASTEPEMAYPGRREG
jgi:hypothetical protein